MIEETTYKVFNIQFKIVQKIMSNFNSKDNSFVPQVLIYQLSRFIFKNPLKIKSLLYQHHSSSILKINQRYLIQYLNKYDLKSVKSQLNINCKQIQSCSNHCTEFSAFITITKVWKPIQLSQQNYNQVLQKSRLFSNFLQGIKVNKQLVDFQNNIDALANSQQHKKKQQILKYSYMVIGQNQNLLHEYLQIIYKYLKDKIVDAYVIKSFVYLMKKNIVVVKIFKNYHTDTYNSQGKYIYFQNSSSKQIKVKNKQITQGPSLKFHAGTWKINDNGKFMIYKQKKTNFNRGKNILIDLKVNKYSFYDIWQQKQYQN